MATAAQCLCRQARQVSQRTQWLSHRRTTTTPISRIHRPFSSTSRRYAEGESETHETSTEVNKFETQTQGQDPAPAQAQSNDKNAPYFNKSFFRSLDPQDQSQYRNLEPSERKEMESAAQMLEEAMSENNGATNELGLMAAEYGRDVRKEFPRPREERLPMRKDFMNMSERQDIGPDDHFDQDDITSDAHRELEQHREIREMSRLAGWEMPLLANLQVPFTPPTKATPLRFRYTTYMGEQHPASRKVVVQFSPKDLDLTQQQQTKLIKIAGARYNPSTNTVKMSCESLETQAQNKRYLGDTIAKLITEAKDSTDTFEDVPFDFRHVKEKKSYKFPRRWLLTEERKKALEEKRAAGKEDETRLIEQGKIVSGVAAIEAARQIDLQKVEEPVMVEAKARLPAGKMGRKQMGQQGRP